MGAGYTPGIGIMTGTSMHYHTAGAPAPRWYPGSVSRACASRARVCAYTSALARAPGITADVVGGEMNNFRTGTQLRARTSRVPSSRPTGAMHARTHARTHARGHARTHTRARGIRATPWRGRVTRRPACPCRCRCPSPPHLPPGHPAHAGRSFSLREDAPQSCYHLYFTAGNYFGPRPCPSGVR